MGQVRIGTCANPIDGAFVRSMFEARGIRCVIGGERHASLLGPIAGAFLTLDIWVATEDAEAASELLREVRETDADAAPDPRAAMDPGELDAIEDDGAWAARAHELTEAAQGEHAAADVALVRAERVELDAMRDRSFHQRRAIHGLVASVVPTFGMGHLVTGAPLRGLLLAAVEILGILHAAAGDRLGLVAIVGAIATDIAGTGYRFWKLRK